MLGCMSQFIQTLVDIFNEHCQMKLEYIVTGQIATCCNMKINYEALDTTHACDHV